MSMVKSLLADTVKIEAKANSEPVAEVGTSNEEAVIGEQVSLDGTNSW